MREFPTRIIGFTLVVLFAACTGTPGDSPSAGQMDDSVPVIGAASTEALFDLADGTESLLVYPVWVSPDSGGTFLVADHSDRDVKIYDGSGKRVGTLGSAGRGPSQFAALTAAFPVDTGLIAVHDFESASLVTMNRGGREVARTSLDTAGVNLPADVRRVAEDRLLVVYHPGHNRSGVFLRLISPNGTELARFFDLREYFDAHPEFRFRSNVVADGVGDCVFAGTTQSDSIWVFDEGGRQVAAAPVRGPGLVPSFFHERDRQPPAPYLVGVVATAGCRAVASFRAVEEDQSSRRFQSETLLQLDVSNGFLIVTGKGTIPGPLVGRDHVGRPLVIELLDDPPRRFRLHSIVMEGR